MYTSLYFFPQDNIREVRGGQSGRHLGACCVGVRGATGAPALALASLQKQHAWHPGSTVAGPAAFQFSGSCCAGSLTRTLST